MPNKLHLKRTPEEEAARRLRKKEKKAIKRRRHEHDSDEGKSRRKRSRLSPSPPRYKWESDDEEFIGPEPAGFSSTKPQRPHHNYKPDYDAIQAELEEARWREKLSSAFDEDEALDSLEARFNSFAHVPMHWGGGAQKTRSRPNFDDDDFTKLDPMTMDEEDYIEWVRRGMYRKTHTREYEEQQQKKNERASRRAKEKVIQAETERLEKAAAEERRKKKREKENRKWAYAREEYHRRWKELLNPSTQLSASDGKMRFSDIPWPVLSGHRQKKEVNVMEDPISVSLDDLNRDAIASFLFTSCSAPETGAGDRERKERKDKLRETFLRFHPDKFEGRFMQRVRPADQEKVKIGLANVVRVLNDLMEEGG
ncbi:hypothetical protein WG66_000487 [Moniliophthora roreri]|nr:hypothetical protein WG66_000487 [Moniliophthora roreri]